MGRGRESRGQVPPVLDCPLSLGAWQVILLPPQSIGVKPEGQAVVQRGHLGQRSWSPSGLWAVTGLVTPLPRTTEGRRPAHTEPQLGLRLVSHSTNRHDSGPQRQTLATPVTPLPEGFAPRARPAGASAEPEHWSPPSWGWATGCSGQRADGWQGVGLTVRCQEQWVLGE